MNENYEILSNGVIKQKKIEKILYNYDYSNNYNSYKDNGTNFAHLRLGALLGILGKTPTSILDVGYGNGDFLKAASKIIPECYGADISDYPVPKNCKKIELNDNKYYDVICFFDSLEHFDDINIIGSLNCEYIFISVPWCHYFNDNWFTKWYHRKENEHLWHFNKKALESHFAIHGYKCIYTSSIEDTIRKNSQALYYPNILTCMFQKIESNNTKIAKYYNGKSIIVTGGTGFIGRNIVYMLLSTDVANIYVFDRTLKHDFKNSRVKYIKGDLLNNLEDINILDFDILFHEAANVDTTCIDESHMLSTNVEAFKRIVDICERKNAKIMF